MRKRTLRDLRRNGIMTSLDSQQKSTKNESPCWTFIWPFVRLSTELVFGINPWRRHFAVPSELSQYSLVLGLPQGDVDVQSYNYSVTNWHPPPLSQPLVPLSSHCAAVSMTPLRQLRNWISLQKGNIWNHFIVWKVAQGKMLCLTRGQKSCKTIP